MGKEKEITNEPKGYARLKHKQYVEEVKEHPKLYLQDIRRVVKESL